MQGCSARSSQRPRGASPPSSPGLRSGSPSTTRPSPSSTSTIIASTSTWARRMSSWRITPSSDRIMSVANRAPSSLEKNGTARGRLGRGRGDAACRRRVPAPHGPHRDGCAHVRHTRPEGWQVAHALPAHPARRQDVGGGVPVTGARHGPAGRQVPCSPRALREGPHASERAARAPKALHGQNARTRRASRVRRVYRLLYSK